MGSNNTPKKQRYLSIDEIKKENNNFIIDLFQKYKNFEGFLSKSDFIRITNGLIDSNTTNIIFQICSSKEDKLSKNDFMYFYALLRTKSFDAKLYFLLYFIFEENTILRQITYTLLVKKYYQNSLFLTKVFQDSNIIKNDVIEKEKVYEYINNNYRKEIENYIFNKEISDFNIIEEEEKFEQNNNNEFENNYNFDDNYIDNKKYILLLSKKNCSCLAKKNNNIYFSIDFYSLNAS